MITRFLKWKRPRRSALLVLGGALVVAAIMAATGHAVVSDSGTVDVQVPDKTTSKVNQETAQGAFVSYFGDSDTTFGASGTGLFDPFVRLQGSPTEQGYNTCSQSSCGGDVSEFDTKTGTWTHAILVSKIPQRPCPDLAGTPPPPPPPALNSETCFELFNDINDSNSAKYISLNKVQVFYTDNPRLTGYATFSTSPPAGTTLEYNFNGDILIHDVNQGSGRGDLRYDIPIGSGGVPLPPNCNYGNPLCNTYFVLYSQWGTTTTPAPDGKTYASDGGFEEWKVKIYPTPPDVQVVKTPDSEATAPGTVSAGSNAVFTIVVTNNGPITATGVTLTDTLPTIAGSGWTVGGADAASCSGTNPHAGGSTLSCAFGDIPFPGSRTITLTSPTTSADCTRSGTVTGDIDNTASISATNEDSTQLGNNSDHGDVHVVCAAILIQKESTKGTNPLVSNAGAVFSITGPGGYSKTVKDNNNPAGTATDEDSTVGQVCISGLAVGDYTVNETSPPSGYGGASQTDVTAHAGAGTDCGTSKPTGTDIAVFTNPPLYDFQVNFKDDGSGETSATIACSPGDPADSTTATNPWQTSKTYTNRSAFGDITCTIHVDP
jgi:uncharacterized repeat protein (TIGR01451 family)